MQFSRALRALPVVFWLGPSAPDASLAAQARYRITTDGAWFFQEAGGKRLARLARGAQVAGGDARGDWLAVTLEGWIFEIGRASCRERVEISGGGGAVTRK